MGRRLTFIIFALLLTGESLAEPDATITWNLDGFDFGVWDVNLIVLDLEIGVSAIAAHGYVSTESIQNVPATGSCVAQTEPEVWCTIAIESFSINMTIQLSTLNGVALLIDPDNSSVAQGSLQFVAIE